MDNRLELNDKLKSILNNSNVYFQPPPSVQLSYPCVIYNIGEGDTMRANNSLYKYTHRYDLIFIFKKPTNSIIDTVLTEFQMCSIERAYINDNLNHYAFRLYY